MQVHLILINNRDSLVKLPNKSVQRTGASHSAQLRSGRERRLAPAADACR